MNFIKSLSCVAVVVFALGSLPAFAQPGAFGGGYGPALNVRQLATLLQHAGAVRALELDINPAWTSYEYYQGKPADPTPHPVLPTQQGATDRYYGVYSRDFTAVFAR